MFVFENNAGIVRTHLRNSRLGLFCRTVFIRLLHTTFLGGIALSLHQCFNLRPISAKRQRDQQTSNVPHEYYF